MYRSVYKLDNTENRVVGLCTNLTNLEEVKKSILFLYGTPNTYLRITSSHIIEENRAKRNQNQELIWNIECYTDVFSFDEFIDKNGKFKKIPSLGKYLDDKELWKEQHKNDAEKKKAKYAKQKAKKEEKKTEALENAMLALSHDLDKMAWDMSDG